MFLIVGVLRVVSRKSLPNEVVVPANQPGIRRHLDTSAYNALNPFVPAAKSRLSPMLANYARRHLQQSDVVRPAHYLQAGCRILDPVMERSGFTRFEKGSGRGSGGDFAWCEYLSGERRLELHFRRSLGLVRYHIGSDSMTHSDYMHQLLGSAGGNRYPGYSDDPLDGFRHLRYDLEHFCSDFLSGDGGEFRELAERIRSGQITKLPRTPRRNDPA